MYVFKLKIVKFMAKTFSCYQQQPNKNDLLHQQQQQQTYKSKIF